MRVFIKNFTMFFVCFVSNLMIKLFNDFQERKERERKKTPKIKIKKGIKNSGD